MKTFLIFALIATVIAVPLFLVAMLQAFLNGLMPVPMQFAVLIVAAGVYFKYKYNC